MAMHAGRAEYYRSEQERFEREREARRIRFSQPLFDFTSAHDESLANEKLARDKKIQERSERLKSYLNETDKNEGDSPNLYEAMYATKGNLLTPEDYADPNQFNPNSTAKRALADISSVIKDSRSRRANNHRDEPTLYDTSTESVPHVSKPSPRNAGERESVKNNNLRDISKMPWSVTMFRFGICSMADSWRRRSIGRGEVTVVDIRDEFGRLEPYQRLHEEILAFIVWAALSKQETKARTEILANISIISQALWPDCQLIPFGSFYNGLSLPGADIDICVQNVPCGDNTRNEIHELARLLRQCPFASEVTAVTKARVPIVKFRASYDDIQVDLTINQESALKTSDYIFQRPLRPLILVVKMLLRANDLNETYKGGVGSYMLFNMLIHHLQQEAKNRPVVKGAKDLPTRLENVNLGELLTSFLKRYANFDYVFSAIDIRGDGRIFPKEEMSDELCNRLYVVSPLEPHLDVGKSSYRMDEVVDLFGKTYKRLKEVVDVPASSSSALACIVDPADDMFYARDTSKSVAAHPSVYESPPFPEISDKMIHEAYYSLEPYLESHRARRYQRRFDGPYERPNNSHGQRLYERGQKRGDGYQRAYDRYR